MQRFAYFFYALIVGAGGCYLSAPDDSVRDGYYRSSGGYSSGGYSSGGYSSGGYSGGHK